ncbi:hypothetical protein [Spiribacter vilamensis]|uniref:Sulfotransferase domain-containing protein n=1 Tax=Spiribacter vilamensis TaxID=531306 RepID=A0A4Q8D2I9_9GAMM|nr:hypothetical protein [Spiribacter vilamensis]RZU99609.1 hypothetical protein EV698_1902 [Spiribacter vilamensis]TVO61429.1 hypothetical protein FPL09_04725 [Spiribacter vilamensis]
MTVKPNFVGIGGQKCASTWLSECLRSHPNVFMSSPKELRYFVDHEKKGIAWYLSFFDNAGGYQCRGEFASNYIYFPESAAKIREALGEVKIIAVVREPAGRVLSHIKHLIRDGDLPPMEGVIDESKLKQIVDKHPKVISNSFYFEGLASYRSAFGASSVYVVSQAACEKKTSEVLSKLWRFLGVSSDVIVGDAENVVSAGVNPRFYCLEKLRRKIFSSVKYSAPWLINASKKIGVSSAYRKVNQGRSIDLDQSSIDFVYAKCGRDWEKTQSILDVN